MTRKRLTQNVNRLLQFQTPRFRGENWLQIATESDQAVGEFRFLHVVPIQSGLSLNDFIVLIVLSRASSRVSHLLLRLQRVRTIEIIQTSQKIDCAADSLKVNAFRHRTIQQMSEKFLPFDALLRYQVRPAGAKRMPCFELLLQAPVLR